MFCDHCGNKLGEGATFCSSCGKGFGAPAATAPRRALATHIKALGILWIVHGSMHVIPGVVLMTVFNRQFLPPDVPPFIFNFMPLLGSLFLFGGGLGILAGIGLLMRVRWARMGALILGGFNLINIPFGTALGIYTLWALLPSDHEAEYRALSQTA